MLHRLHISVDGTSQPRVDARLQVAIEACRLNVRLLRFQNEDVRLGRLSNEIELVEYRALDFLRDTIDDEIRVDVDKGGPLWDD